MNENAEKRSHEITPAEDLMFEHGVIERMLLIYNEAVKRIESGENISPVLISDTVDIIRSFTENYHEKQEEQYIFPVLEKKNQHVELVETLRKQHDLGRKVTDNIIDMIKNPGIDFKQLAVMMKTYETMYIPHISRENSIVFRTFSKLVPENEYIELGEKFEQNEEKHLGEDGFDRIAGELDNIETALSIHDLAKYNPVEKTIS